MVKVKRTSAPKVRCANTMSESTFWSFIRSALRKRSIYWKPIAVCKQEAKRPYKGINKRQKFEYQCNQCKGWFMEKKVNVDHLIPAGKLNCAADLPGFVERLFCEAEHLQVLCETCHNKKTYAEKTKKPKK